VLLRPWYVRSIIRSPHTSWILQQSEQICRRLAGLDPSLRAALQDHNLVNLSGATLSNTGLDPRWLKLEITESVAMSNLDRSTRMLESLQAGAASVHR
jgi:EAL domain-containing protein (putative c-di-GMP-specific phosphodiesterase class I)